MIGGAGGWPGLVPDTVPLGARSRGLRALSWKEVAGGGRPMGRRRPGRVRRRYRRPGGIRKLDNVLQRAMLLQERETINPNGLNLNQDDPATRRVVLIEVRFPFEREDCSLARVEQRLLEQAVQFCNGNSSEVARLLGLSRGALRHRTERLSLSRQPRKLERR